MRKWNGWGDVSTGFPANPGVQSFLKQTLGKSRPWPGATYESVLAPFRRSVPILVCTKSCWVREGLTGVFTEVKVCVTRLPEHEEPHVFSARMAWAVIMHHIFPLKKASCA